jgi:hypothetical protein
MNTIQNQNKVIPKLRMLITIACILGGLLAGENAFRYVMEVPAWRHIDIINWGEYSRNADLKNGVFLLPFEAITNALLLVVSSTIIIRKKGQFLSAALWMHFATGFALVGLVLTFFAAPYMLSVRTMDNDVNMLQQTFNNFHFLGSLRAIAQILSFFACVLALGKVYELKSE